MRFDTLEFAIFFLAVLCVERLLERGRARLWLLLLASYFFYGSWSPPFLLLLVFSTVLDFSLGRVLGREERPDRRRLLLYCSLLGNLGVLAFFKYSHLFTDIWALLPSGTALGETAFPRRDDLLIPLGISFYTFQSMSYTIDVYRRRIEASRDFLEFSLFVSFFPQLIAGPVMRASELLPQIQRQHRANRTDILVGVELFLVGAFKKVVIADNLARLSDSCFAAPQEWSGAGLVLGMLAYMGQFYCDFSGYSTMARGLGRMLGFQLPRNFHYPLLARTAWEFRRGWHITMSKWFRDYVYRPLTNHRQSQFRRACVMLLTWVLFALWHGGTWNFLWWGLLNGLVLAGHRMWRRPLRRLFSFPGRDLFSRAAWLLFFIPSMALFRSPDLATATDYAWRMLTLAPGARGASVTWAVVIAMLLVAHVASRRWYREGVLAKWQWPARIAAVSTFSTMLALWSTSDKPFIYFQF